jgi:hypothetical protein
VRFGSSTLNLFCIKDQEKLQALREKIKKQQEHLEVGHKRIPFYPFL